ncbi:MAG: aromatic ring-opening dioxygenase subunit LigA [Gammaproteobacteria bacterium]|nr:aromatic ring-opening dioxygenase subunit LigA [Gammaproteobacteria bacterium]
MSLYYVQKLLYRLNRDPHTRVRFGENFEGLLDDFDLTDEEKTALRAPDIGLLYVMGVNGQILMHYAALRGFEWDRYIQAMRDGLEMHGPVRTGLYRTTDGNGAV